LTASKNIFISYFLFIESIIFKTLSMMKNFLLTIMLLFSTAIIFAQQATLKGVVTDSKGETVISGSVVLTAKSGVKRVVETGIDGDYSIKVDPGTYTVEFSYVGLTPQRFDKVLLPVGEITSLNVVLDASGSVLEEVVVKEYKVPLIKQDNTTSGSIVTSEQIAQMPTRNISAIVALTPGVSSDDGSGTTRIKGSRGEGTVYMVDGVRVNSGSLPPAQEIEQLQVITGGIEAQYGDATGGLVSIQTKGPSAKYSGGVELETSKFLDPYDNNLINANVSGPIIKKNGQSILGFRLSGNMNLNKDGSPSAVDNIYVKPEKLRELEENPLLRYGSSAIANAQTLKNSDVDNFRSRLNDNDRRYDINGKLDARLSPNIDVTLSGQYANSKNRFSVNIGTLGERSWNMMNYERNPYDNIQRYRTNLRFRHRLGGNASSDSKEKKRDALIQNASYTLQGGYENTKNTRSDLIHGDNYFNYGYIGSFKDSIFRTVRFFGQDSAAHVGNRVDFAGYTPGNINPVLANYNKLAADTKVLANFVNLNGFQNTTYRDAWSYRNVGQVYNNVSKTDNDLINVNVNSSFDLVPKNAKNRHSIQFGLVYEQRTNRNYRLSPFGLWELGRQLADQNFNGLEDGSSLEGGGKKPLTIIGQTTAGNLSIPLYANYVVPNADGKFYKEARAVRNIGIKDHLNIDDMTPEQLSLNMFSSRELTQRDLVEYYGFDYLGNKLATNYSFDQFFTEEDGNGVRTFPIAALRPIYSAAFIQDKFQLNDIIFRVGLRVDRYDANTKILKDPYSLYEVLGANDFYTNILKNKAGQPGTVGDDYKVYVKDPTAITPSVKAFRDGDQWYDEKGTTINNPSLLFNGGVPDPYYANQTAQKNKDWIKERSFAGEGTKGTFVDYTPQVNFMPRLAFSFPISTEANFFANYDVLVSRPTSNTVATALDYFYFADAGRISEDAPINNPALKPEKTVYYEVGFQQKLTNSSALKLTAYYKELRDQIQRRTYLYVPIVTNYYTYGNIDFGTVKGFTFGYDLRRTGNIAMSINYTLQFADGTGSDANAQKGLNTRGNLRSLYPLSFDERHNVQASIDYRFPSGKKYVQGGGPRIAGINILQGVGFNVIANTVSGSPYTAKLVADKFGGSGTVGQINGARLPWKTNFDLKIDKNFSIGKEAKPLDFNVFLRIQNLLDSRNVRGVYSASGSPANDGYLQSQVGQQEVSSLQQQGRDVQSFLDAYHWALLNPGNFSFPRRIYLGTSFYF
jgi:outer membrane receptor for ferrienterochelin and colicin